MKTDDLFVPTSTGLAEHIPDLSGNAIKIYIFILLKAKMFDPEAGTFHKSITDLCSILKISRSSFYKAIKELSPKYLKIKPGKNECVITKFTVVKYKKLSDFTRFSKFCLSNKHTGEDTGKDTSEDTSTDTSGRTSGNTSRSHKPPEVNDLQRPKAVRGSKDSKKHKDKDIYPFEEIVALWNAYAFGLPQIRKLTDKRKNKIKKRCGIINELYQGEDLIDSITKYVNQITESPFLLGNNDRNWKADFDFAFRSDDIVIGIFEGKYANSGEKKKKSSVESWMNTPL